MLESKSSALPLGDSPTSFAAIATGWIEGLEPSASRATIWRANQLRHTHHKYSAQQADTRCLIAYERDTRVDFCLAKRLLIQKSNIIYNRSRFVNNVPKGIRTPDPRLRRPLLYPAELWTHLHLLFANEKRVMGIEPTYPAWKAGVLPLNYTRMKSG